MAAVANKPAVGNKAKQEFNLIEFLAGAGKGRLTATGFTAKGNLKVTDAGGNEGYLYLKTLQKALEGDNPSMTIEGNEIVCDKGFRLNDGIFWPKSDFVAEP